MAHREIILQYTGSGTGPDEHLIGDAENYRIVIRTYGDRTITKEADENGSGETSHQSNNESELFHGEEFDIEEFLKRMKCEKYFDYICKRG